MWREYISPVLMTDRSRLLLTVVTISLGYFALGEKEDARHRDLILLVQFTAGRPRERSMSRQ